MSAEAAQSTIIAIEVRRLQINRNRLARRKTLNVPERGVVVTRTVHSLVVRNGPPVFFLDAQETRIALFWCAVCLDGVRLALKAPATPPPPPRGVF